MGIGGSAASQYSGSTSCFVCVLARVDARRDTVCGGSTRIGSVQAWLSIPPFRSRKIELNRPAVIAGELRTM